MIDMTNVRIWRSNKGTGSYGQPVPHEDLSWLVLETIESEILEVDTDSGDVEVAGQWYRWRRG